MSHHLSKREMNWTYPSKGKWATLDASSNALVQVGPGRGFAWLFVPSQWWSPPEGVVTLCPKVRMVPSKMVVVDPSIRKLTKVGIFSADESKASTATTVRVKKCWSILFAFFFFFLDGESTCWVGSDWAAFFGGELFYIDAPTLRYRTRYKQTGQLSDIIVVFISVNDPNGIYECIAYKYKSSGHNQNCKPQWSIKRWCLGCPSNFGPNSPHLKHKTVI